MLTKERYQIALALTREEADRLEKLKKKGIKVIEVFRAGLKLLEEK